MPATCRAKAAVSVAVDAAVDLAAAVGPVGAVGPVEAEVRAAVAAVAVAAARAVLAGAVAPEARTSVSSANVGAPVGKYHTPGVPGPAQPGT